MTADILGLGEPLIEMVRVRNTTHDRPAYLQGFGGDTSTAIIAAARQGARTGYISAVGDDMFGEALRDLWSRESVDHSHVLTRPGDPTGVCFIDPDPAGRKFTYARRGSAASHFAPESLPTTTIAQAKALHLSGITLAVSPFMRAAGMRAVETARAEATLVSLDLNHRPALWARDLAVDTLTKVAAQADIVFASDDEAELLFGDTTSDAIITRFQALGVKIVVAKQGAAGAVLATDNDRVEVPAAPSNPVDASGAGDSFAGAFLAHYLETSDPHHSALKAAKVAAATVSGFGAVEPIPRR